MDIDTYDFFNDLTNRYREVLLIGPLSCRICFNGIANVQIFLIKKYIKFLSLTIT